MKTTTSAAAAPTTRRRVLVPLLLVAVAATVLISDQIVKNWVVATLPEGETVPVLGGFLQWHFVRNPGAAFSIASGQTWIFTILSAIVVGVIIWQIRRLRSVPWALFLGLLLGGVLGNLTDRLTREPGFPEGHVIDFILTPWMMPAIYNIADIGIVSGMILFVLITIFGLSIEGGREKRGAETEGEAEAEAADPEVADASDGAADASDGAADAADAPAQPDQAPGATEERSAGGTP
ncbi:signal peptidase II [Leucobacter aridicollis]|uniref:signal peptidase II n=1 Tax=Leucobacter aridicollis TaxID=283878 RepID=UPI00286DA87E|nr:signal peptidase II [Leucobacter aridicollis]MCS3428579.1 signal peptidase II [Leucobacter aridicollis]